ncbi:MAG: 1,4-dihydroxy-2-naphthoate octaprenyltransferase [Coriobacteriales bacterium]|jgi:1,4-dihydroxy-2-naphthoate octaprenyltransferase
MSSEKSQSAFSLRNLRKYLRDDPTSDNPFDTRVSPSGRASNHSPAFALWESSCPRVFPIWLCSGIVPGALALANGVFDGITCLLCTLLCWALLTLVCWADDIGDVEKGVDGDTRLGPQKPLQRGELTMEQMKHAVVACIGVVAVLGLGLLAYSFWRNGLDYTSAAVFLIGGCICLAAALGYTIPKRAYGYFGFGELVAWFFFGPVAGMGGYFLYAHTIDLAVFFPASSVGLLLAASINLANIRDIENDLAFGKLTIAARLGAKRAFVFQCALIVAAILGFAAFPIIHGMTNPLNYVFLVAALPFVKHLVDLKRVVDDNDPEHIRMMMWPYMLAYLALGLAFCICVVL